MSNELAVSVSNLRYRWPGAASDTIQIDCWKVPRSSRVFLHGPSGSGKSTLIGLLGGVLSAEAGELLVCDSYLSSSSQKALSSSVRDRFRADNLGFIFQQFNLIPYLSVEENILLGLVFSQKRRANLKASGRSPQAEVGRLLGRLELSEREIASRPAGKLSVGQQQRVSIARALIGSPQIVIADEPTSALDSDVRNMFMNLLFSEVNSIGATLIFVSHDLALSQGFDENLSISSINAPRESASNRVS